VEGHFLFLFADGHRALRAGHAHLASEFYRGGRVISKHTGQGMFASMVQLTHRNTRRYGGYIVHFGVVVVIIGFAGAAFISTKEQEMGYGDKMTIGPTL